MIPTRSTSLACLLALLALGAPAHAQNAPASGGGDTSNWPRTFTGQPDFAFTREEVLKDAKGRAENSKESVTALMPTLTDVLNDDTKLDPLNLAMASSVSTVVSGSDVSGTAPAETLMDKLLSTASALPTFNTSYTVDVEEFTSTLNQTILATVSGWHPDKGRYSYGALINSLTLQAIVTSPERYAVINGQRYGEGDSFQLKSPISVPDDEIMAALQKKMPVSGTVPQSAYSQYQAAYDQALAAFATLRTSNPAVGRQTLSLPVTVKTIEPRKVTLDINGEEHDLTIKFAY